MNLLCVDIGTSSLKAAVISEDGKVLAFKRRFLLLYTTENASREWFSTLQNVIKDLFEINKDLKVDGLCVSGNGPTLVTSTGKTMLWNEEVQPLKTKSLFIPRIAAFKDKLGAEWDEIKTIFSGPEFLINRLTDAEITILPHERYLEAYWTKTEFEKCGLSSEDFEKMPPFVAPGELAGKLTHKAASFLTAEDNGIVDGLPVYCGAPDFISALVGTNTLVPGTLCDRAGSSEGINFCTEKMLVAEGLRSLPSIAEGKFNASVLLPETGTKFAAFKQKLEREAGHEFRFHDLIDDVIMSDGTNASYDQGKYLMMQTALDVRNAVAKLRSAAKDNGIHFPDSMVITGGQCLHDGWNQMKADITGMVIYVTECPDAELLGDAIFVFVKMGLFSSIEEAASKLVKKSKKFVPHEDAE